MASLYAMNLYRGDTAKFSFTFWADVDKTQPADLTGVVPKSEIRDKSGGTIIIPLTLTISANTINATLPAASAKLLPVPSAVWDLQLTYANGDVVTPLAGPVNVTADVTDSTPGTLVAVAERKESYDAWRKQQAA